jgi:hypothetical protein
MVLDSLRENVNSFALYVFEKSPVPIILSAGNIGIIAQYPQSESNLHPGSLTTKPSFPLIKLEPGLIPL